VSLHHSLDNERAMEVRKLMRNRFADGQVPAVFSLALSRPTLASPAPGGLLAIGGIPDIPHDPDFVSVPIFPIVSKTYAFYSIPVDGFSIIPPSNAPAPPFPYLNRPNYTIFPITMMIDSGSTLLHLPDAIAVHIASLFVPRAVYSTNSDTFIVPCSAVAPRVGVIIAGKTFWVNEADLMSKEPGAVSEGHVGLCTLGVTTVGGGDAVLGDTWLKGVLAVFDVGGGVMRFAGREVY
jgi:hypothetical protein